jgi:hypothetical protein
VEATEAAVKALQALDPPQAGANERERLTTAETSTPGRSRTYMSPLRSPADSGSNSFNGTTSDDDSSAVAFRVALAEHDPQFAEIAAAWPSLPEHVRGAILTLARGRLSATTGDQSE